MASSPAYPISYPIPPAYTTPHSVKSYMPRTPTSCASATPVASPSAYLIPYTALGHYTPEDGAPEDDVPEDDVPKNYAPTPGFPTMVPFTPIIPDSDLLENGWYVVTIGRKVGIFTDWNYTSTLVIKVSGPCSRSIKPMLPRAPFGLGRKLRDLLK
ncbi:hypothetical protein BD779DRAFT_1677706 [Infundibulicybe gibba]|nr:hypothetical protein BD779DRAFT_1677706 [Infundibulicybe gibba]